MLRKFIQGLIASLLVVIAPVMGNTDMLYAPHLWIMVAVGVAASLFQPAYNPFRPSPHPEDKGTAAQIIWSVYLTQLLILLEAAYYRYPDCLVWTPLTTTALLVMLAGLGIRTWAVVTLGTYFTWHIHTQENQPIIDQGPYRFVRHPGYFGALLTYTSTALFLNTRASFVVSVITLSAAFLRRIHHEEAELLDHFGPAYDDYRKRVKKFIPIIW